ncbi:hypothetical protein R1flu_004656 [Riccia fluitans]|uniref:Uncharacterized protein n=1 Tax=Riccia fluitans TaxID=41844 RepID=A0ABD1YU04_9MARC
MRGPWASMASLSFSNREELYYGCGREMHREERPVRVGGRLNQGLGRILDVDTILSSVQQSPHLLKHPPVQEALTMLHRTLVNAFLLAQNCEHSTTLSSVMRNIPAQFKVFEMEIQQILSVLSLANLHLNWQVAYNNTNYTFYHQPTPEKGMGPQVSVHHLGRRWTGMAMGLETRLQV